MSDPIDNHRHRIDENGNVEYLTVHGEPVNFEGQAHFSKKARYLKLIAKAVSEGEELEGALFFPKDLEPEFYNPSIEDALGAQSGVLSFLRDMLASDSSQFEELSSPGVRGLYYILQGAIDTADRLTDLIGAQREFQREVNDDE